MEAGSADLALWVPSPGRSCLAIALLVSMLVTEGSAMTVSGSLRRTGQAEPGGEQAANTLQPDGNSRQSTAANGKVRGVIEALRLVARWQWLRSHGRGLPGLRLSSDLFN